jgi:hypothetical protein
MSESEFKVLVTKLITMGVFGSFISPYPVSNSYIYIPMYPYLTTHKYTI